ncbi:hypothetical protein EYE40_07425 [Glaciihabitans arcticus]|uniref:Immunity protein Imm1 n=1 Tax=Glaciihabitans arcticus TaxID=2668039 RepID=A0A4Q9GQT6_9MICO|nr:hypothetical protein [Glaciihabitans arcticus]TBN57242.1 hypothetical protein EYE40_07425 [Glaciihabitans arcticus]
MQFDFEIVGTGWARSSVSDGNSKVELTASYLSDALGDLLAAIRSLLEGGDAARCSWEEEPGEYRWIFTREGGEAQLVILVFPDNFPPMRDDEGVEIFRTSEPLTDLAASVGYAAQRVLDEYGEAEYLRRWVEAPFPTSHLRTIQEMVASHPR